MKYIKFIIIIIAVLFTGSSCKKFLDVKPRGEIIPEKTSDFELMLNNEALLLTYPWQIMLMADDGWTAKTLNDVNSNAYAYFWNKDLDYEVESSPAVWGMMYNSIYNVNAILENVLASANGLDTKKKAVWAEALTHKANLYFQLMTVFARAYNPSTADKDLGVPIMNNTDVTAKTPPRSSVKACFDTIINCLTTAIPLLPEANINNARVTKKVAQSLLSRVYLYMGEFDKSAQYADDVLATKPPMLNYNTVPFVDYGFMKIYRFPDSQKNPEVIWHRQTDNLMGFNDGPYYTQELLSLFETGDKRREIFPADLFFNGNLIYFVTRPNYGGILTSELYLNKAEALARKGSIPEAMAMIDSVRIYRFAPNRFTPSTAGTTEEAITKVLRERRRDLAFIGTRWADMKRLNARGEMPDVTRTNRQTGEVLATLKAGSSYTFEIPKRVQMFNPDMPKNF